MRKKTIYERLDELESRMDALNHILKTEDDEGEIKELEDELDKIYTEYNKLMDGGC